MSLRPYTLRAKRRHKIKQKNKPQIRFTSQKRLTYQNIRCSSDKRQRKTKHQKNHSFTFHKPQVLAQRADWQVLQVAQHLEEQPMLEFDLAEEHQELEPFWKYEASATLAMGRKETNSRHPKSLCGNERASLKQENA